MSEQMKAPEARSMGLRPETAGPLAAAGLLLFYAVLVSLAESPTHALEELGRLWPWIAVVATGFGVQAALFAQARRAASARQLHGTGRSLAAGGGTSGLSMVACCAHHLTDVLPLLGLGAAAAFLGAYQRFFLLVGVVANALGIVYMLSVIARHRLYGPQQRRLAALARLNYGRVFRVALPAAAAVLIAGGLEARDDEGAETAQVAAAAGETRDSPTSAALEALEALEAQEAAGDGVWVVASGRYAGSAGTVIFDLRFTTHSGSLDFAVQDVASVLVDGVPVAVKGSWEGPGAGGHHRAGQLRFVGLPAAQRQIALVLSDEGRLGTRSFRWEL